MPIARGDNGREDGQYAMQRDGSYRREDGQYSMQQQQQYGGGYEDGCYSMQQQYARGDYYRRGDVPHPMQQQYAARGDYRRDDGPRMQQQPSQRDERYGMQERDQRHSLQRDEGYRASSPPSAASSSAVSSSRKRKADDPTTATAEECASSSSLQSLLDDETMLELTELYVGGLNDGIDNRLVMHWVREYDPILGATRPSPFFAFITLPKVNANALLEAVAMHNVVGLPCHVTIQRARNPRPMEPSVRICDQSVCRAYVNGHCLSKCPFHLPHPLHENDVDYGAMLSGRERKKAKISHKKSEYDEGATQLVQRVSDLEFTASEESSELFFYAGCIIFLLYHPVLIFNSFCAAVRTIPAITVDPFDTQSIYSSSGSTLIPTDDPDETWSIRSSLNASSNDQTITAALSSGTGTGKSQRSICLDEYVCVCVVQSDSVVPNVYSTAMLQLL